MKQHLKDGTPAFTGITVFLMVELINAFANIPVSQQANFEVACNTVMLAVAVAGFFCVGIPSKKRPSGNLSCILSNIVVSAIAFPMNIDVFGHVIQWESLLADLWGWHLGWIVCAAVQVLFLSRLGENLLSLVVSFLKWVKEKAISLEKAVQGVVDIIKQQDKGVILIILGSAGFWIFYLVYRIYHEGVHSVISDADTLWMSIRLWIVCIIVGVLLYIVPTVCHKADAGIRGMDPKRVLAAVVTIAVLAALSRVLPSLMGLMGIVLTILALLVYAAYAVIKTAIKRSGTVPPVLGQNGQPSNGSVQGSSGKNNPAVARKMNPLDVTVVLIAFVVIPLTVIGITTVLTSPGSEILTTEDTTNLTTWLSFLDAALNVAETLLSIFA